MEGLEITVLKLSEVREDNEKLRYDPEFFAKDAHSAYAALRHHRRFGDLVADGYRVVYETTEIIPREIGIAEGLPFFLQAADIETPFIRGDRMGCVARADWDRYTKGRITTGELLIEVKGLAEKVALVTDDIPTNTLVTGTCYKMIPKDVLDGPLLIAYLTCCYGQALKNRLKSNLLVAFVSKEDLFSLPVPDFGNPLKRAIAAVIAGSFRAEGEVSQKMNEAEAALTAAVGLREWQPPEPLTFSLKASDVLATKRLDSQFFAPRYAATRQRFDEISDVRELHEFGKVLKGESVTYDEEGTVPIIRSGDLVDISDDGRFLRALASEPIFALERGDVLISSIGFGSIGKVQVFDKPGRYGTVSEVTVVRQKTLNPYYLAAFLRSPAGQSQIERFITGATGQLHLYPRDVGRIFIPILPKPKQAVFQDLAEKAHTARQRARDLLAAAQCAVEIAIEESEKSAMAYLKTKGV